MLRVIKFGGSCLATPQLVRSAAAAVVKLIELGDQVAVVVSAGGDDTSSLIDELSVATDDSISGPDSFPIISLGEEKSVLLFSSALSSLGVKGIPFFPRRHETWPIVVDTDDNSPLGRTKSNEERDFEIRTEKTRLRFEHHVIPRLNSGEVTVIAGCFAINSNDQVVTFGRGGSDITAAVVAGVLHPDEIVIVKEVEGLLSGDPKLTKDPQRIDWLTAEHYDMITRGGTQAAHSKAYSLLLNNTPTVRIISLQELIENPVGGTVIEQGERKPFNRTDHAVALITLISDNGTATKGIDDTAHCLEDLGILIHNMTCTKDALCLVIDQIDLERAISTLHQAVIVDKQLFTNITQRENVGELRVHCTTFANASTTINQITIALTREKIDVLELILSNIYIYLYLQYSDLERAYQRLERLL